MSQILEESYQASLNRFKRLSNEWDAFSKTQFLDNYLIIDKTEFISKFKGMCVINLLEKPNTLILLSPNNAILYITRTVQKSTNSVKKWLIKALDKKKIGVKELKTIWKLSQLLENDAEKEFFKEAILKFNISKIVPHRWMGKFRCDFVIDDIFLIQIREFCKLSNKNIVLKEIEKERYFQEKGYYCITFFAEEILINPEKCVNKIIEIINSHSYLLKK